MSSQCRTRPSPTDRLVHLVGRTVEGDHDAFRELYDSTHRRVFDVAHRTLRAPDQTVEVVQDVYVQVWQQASSYDAGRGPVLAWLAMLAHRRAVDRVRQVERSRARDQREADLSPTTVPDVADLGLANLEAARVRAALHLLSGHHRDALVLTYLDGHTHLQAAGLLAIPVGTLKSRVRAGLVSLRAQLDVVAAPL